MLLIGAIVIGGYAVYKLVNPLTDGIKTAGDAVGGLVGSVADTGTGLFKTITAGETAVANTLGGEYGLFHVPPGQTGVDVTKVFSSGLVGNIGSSATRGIFPSTPILSPSPYTQETAMFNSPSVKTFVETSKNQQVVGTAGYNRLMSDLPPATITAKNAHSPTGFTTYDNPAYRAIQQINSLPTPKTIGAGAGTIFASGSSVKSVGASGKYKTTL